ncbi:MAG: DUF4372 domain-containing protein [Elusimicrobiota bacterium]
MHCNTILHQLQSVVPRHQFEKLETSRKNNRYVKHFTCWHQFTAMLYAQASGKDSLRDLETALSTQYPKLYHLGLKPVKRSTLADANSNRN